MGGLGNETVTSTLTPMGFFDNLKATAAAMKQGVADAQAAQAAADQAAREAPIAIINPTPQEQIDAGLQRGVVRAVHYSLSDEDGRVASMAVRIYVRARLAGGALGPDTELKIRTSSTVAQALRHGTEIPVTIDAATGVVTGVDVKALAAEIGR